MIGSGDCARSLQLFAAIVSQAEIETAARDGLPGGLGAIAAVRDGPHRNSKRIEGRIGFSRETMTWRAVGAPIRILDKLQDEQPQCDDHRDADQYDQPIQRTHCEPSC